MLDYSFQWQLLMEDPWRGMILQGFYFTVGLVAITSFTSFMMGVVLAIGRSSRSGIISFWFAALINLLRNVPGVFWLLGWFMAVPMLFNDEYRDAINGFPYYGFLCAVIGLTLTGAPFICDIVRAGYASIYKETHDSIQLSGLSNWAAWYHVLLPQMLPPMIPALNVRMVHNLKNTSLAMVISVPELTWQSQEIESSTFASLEITTVVTVIYIVMAILLSRIITVIESAINSRLHTVQKVM